MIGCATVWKKYLETEPVIDQVSETIVNIENDCENYTDSNSDSESSDNDDSDGEINSIEELH